jgi:hypothetical protein
MHARILHEIKEIYLCSGQGNHHIVNIYTIQPLF